MSKLIITPFKGVNGQVGLVIKPSTKKEGWGSVMVIATSHSVTNGILNEKKQVAFMRAKIEQLEKLNLASGKDLNEVLKGLGAKPMRIRVVESLEAQYQGHQPKINPTTKAAITTASGQPIFYNTELADEASTDVLVDAKVATPAIVESALA